MRSLFLVVKPISLVCLLFVSVLPLKASISSMEFLFYEQAVELEYDTEMLYPYDLRLEERALIQACERLQRRPLDVLQQALVRYKTEWKLNDYLFVQLSRTSAQHLYPNNAQKAELTAFMLLAASGYDVRLTYRRQSLHINIYVEDVLYEIPLIELEGRQYADVSAPLAVKKMSDSMYLLDYAPQANGKSCSFLFADWPTIDPLHKQATVAFQYQGQAIELAVDYQPSIAKILDEYPVLDELWYLNAPLSDALKQSLLKDLERMIRGRSHKEALELLVAFTRSAFVYKQDQAAFGKSKPMVADELFYYPFSDCEDRSALFFALVKELLQLPMIVVAYEDHLSIAVHIPNSMQAAVMYEGKRYVFCDPTGPFNSSEIGQIPEGYENKSFEILGVYKAE